MAVLAIAEQGNLLNAPDVYMEKLAVGPGYPDGVIDLARVADRECPRGRRRQGRRGPTRSSSACSTGRATRN